MATPRHNSVPDKGFTRLAAGVLLALAGLALWHYLTAFVPWHTTQRTGLYQQRQNDLEAMRQALAAYHATFGRYPATPGFAGAVDAAGAPVPDWLPGLAGTFVAELPRDPARSHDPNKQYLYHSDGTDYKLIAHGSGDCAMARKAHPEMVDPARNCWAYGYWTPAARTW